jgi:hypothetical protein
MPGYTLFSSALTDIWCRLMPKSRAAMAGLVPVSFKEAALFPLGTLAG